MKIYTLASETGNITVFPTAEAAAAASHTPFDIFTSRQELAELVAHWPAERLLATYNSLPGVKPLKSLTDSQRAAARIWKRVEKLGHTVSTPPEATATPDRKTSAPTKANAVVPAAHGALGPRKEANKARAKRGAHAVQEAPAKRSGGKRPAVPNKGHQAKSRKWSAGATTPREGSKAAQVVALLERKNGATLVELMQKMGWQKHTVRGFMAGTLKKAGYAVESFKSESGMRSYRIHAR